MVYHETIVPIIASVLGGIALILSIYVFKRTLDFDPYRELDSNFMELLKLGLEYPEFWNEKKTLTYSNSFSNDEKARYEIYALMVWNICESVYDRNKIDETWLPAIKTQKRFHLKWLEDNKGRFKEEFINYIMQENMPLRKGRW